ncbi:MAG: lytic transglycosylase domain-containing protein [Rhodospirillales bacterium]
MIAIVHDKPPNRAATAARCVARYAAPLILALSLCAPALAQPKKAKPPAPIKPVIAAKAPQSVTVNHAQPRDQEKREFSFGRAISADDAERYRRIFDLQDSAQFHAADAEIAQLSDTLLLGHVRAQRYLHNSYTSRYGELAEWLSIYNDQPQAPRIYSLALKKKPAGAATPTPSSFVTPTAQYSGVSAPAPSTKSLSGADRAKANALRQKVLVLAQRDSHVQALKLLESADAQNLFTPGEIDRLRADIASRLFLSGKNDALAFDTARDAASGDEAVMANWTAGLAAWRLGSYSEAARRFQTLAEAPNVSSWNAAAGAFWAARSNLLAGNPEKYNPWMKKAASYPRTFYGILAQKTFGADPSFLWTPPIFTKAQFDLLLADRVGKRALALLAAGEIDGAVGELYALTSDADSDTVAAVLALAENSRLPELALKVANSVGDDAARDRIPGMDAALYPVPLWQPKGGFVIDRALVYAFIRQESAFNPRARSWAGASGLMQLMPATARAMANRYGSPADAHKLYSPDVNMMLGQFYLRYLMEYEPIGPNLFLVAAAYNSGPGSLQRWQNEVNYNDDPLLFVASIPVRETRLFIERVMANLWIYQLRLGQKTPTLDALASHRWPLYVSVDGANSIQVGGQIGGQVGGMTTTENPSGNR